MRIATLILTALLAIALPGCSDREKQPAESGHDHPGEKGEGAEFAEGKGIVLREETGKAIGLELEEAQERKLAATIPVEAQIYRAAGEPTRPDAEQTEFAYAVAYINTTAAGQLKPGDKARVKIEGSEYPARLWRIDPSSREAVGSPEAILEISDPRKILQVGDFASGDVTVTEATSDVLAVPRPAVLETFSGKFVYVQNGGYLLRTPVSTGVEGAGYIEITDGLYAGDVVANKPVETLYLIELRATKGGGHCH